MGTPALNSASIGQVFGYDPQTPNNGLTQFLMNAAANWFAFGFLAPPSGPNLTEISLYLQITGTINAGELTLTLYSDSQCAPNTSIVASTTVSPAAPYTNQSLWVRFTFSQALTGGTYYWGVLTNGNATPTTNYPRPQYGINVADNMISGGVTNYALGAATSTNSGGPWSGKTGCPGVRVGFADGTYLGLPMQSSSVGSAQAVYGTNENGAMFTLPGAVNAVGLEFFLRKQGSPTGNPYYRLYNGTTHIADTLPIVAGSVVVNGYYPAYFTSAQSLAAGTYRVTIADSAGNTDNATNYWTTFQETFDSDANSQLLIPYSAVQTSWNGSAWTQTANTLVPFALLLQMGSEFAASGGGGATPTIGSSLIRPCRRIGA